MTFPFFHYQPPQEPPFTLFIEHRNQTRDGHWKPAATVLLTSSLRTSGFLWALPPEDLKSFLLLLTFLTPNGDISPTLLQLARAFRLSEAKTRDRMARLVEARWHNQPLVLSLRLGSGLEAYAPNPGLLPVREEDPAPMVDSAPLYKAAPREAIIEHSRRTYGRPRADVERQIAEQMGYKAPPETSPPPPPASLQTGIETSSGDTNAGLRDELRQVGLLPDQVNELLARFDAVRIRRQLMWLPFRPARNRPGLLLAAIKDDYAAPPNLRRSDNEQQETDLPSTATNES